MEKILNQILDKLNSLEQGQNELKTEVKKNSIKLEDIEKKIATIAEIQTAHKEQTERFSDNILKEQGNTNTLITSSLKNVSEDIQKVDKDVIELKEKFEKVEKVTIQNTYDVAYLKQVK